jgi:gamma-glutamyltranspeptidase
MVRHGIVSTVQPLAAMAGVQILMQGGNAIDTLGFKLTSVTPAAGDPR